MTTATRPRSGLSAVRAEVAITAGGVVASLLVVGANLWMARSIGLDLLSFSLWFVLPAGAMLGGMGAAGGYYLAAIWTETVPSRRLLFDMVAVGLSTWLLSNWLDYYTMVLEDGTRVRNVTSFWQYFTITTEHMKLTIGTRGHLSAMTTGELGGWGYVRELLQVAGFMVGGFAVYAHLADREVCKSCRRYATEKEILVRRQPEAFEAFLSRAGLSLPGVGAAAGSALRNRPFVGLDLRLHECPACSAKWLRPAVVFNTRDGPEASKLARYDLTDDLAERVLRASEETP